MRAAAAGSPESPIVALVSAFRFHRAVVFALAVAFASLILPARPAGAQPPAVEGELIVKFRPGASQSSIDAIKADLGATRIRAFGRIRAEHDRISVGTVAEAIGRYRNHPDVEIIEPNYIVSEAATPNDPFFPQLWGLNNTGQTGGTPGADISATDAWNVVTSAGEVIVAIIDTGVDYTHPDLAANIYANPGEIAGNLIDDDGNGFVDDVRGWDFVNADNDPIDDRGHGTHVAGTIGAAGNNALGVAGVAWSVRLMPLKFLSASGTGTTADAIAAVEYATAMGAHVMNNSWGGGSFSFALLQAIQDASAAGILFVAAAGNASNNNDTFAFYPASYDVPNIVSVAASNHLDQIASFSNYGITSVDLAAPGEEIYSTLPGNGYGFNSGTSMAAPHVSGILALMRARFPLASMTALKTRLLSSVDFVPAMVSFVATNGRANAFLALADPDSIPPAAPTGLEVVESTSSSLRVRWIATGDDGAAGTAAAYEVRYAGAPITEETFPSATLAASAPQPQPSGSPEEMEVTGLDASTTYYVAVRALDELGNPSPISNVASGTTLGPPSIAVSPSSLAQSLLTGASAVRTLDVGNVGEGTLDFTVTGNLVAGSSEVQEFLALERGEPDPRSGDPVATGTGGPDAFGYRWVDSDQPGGPVFDWVEISGIGTRIPMSLLDENYGPIPIGFPFPFYGAEFTTLRACTHGWLSFTNFSTQYTNQPLPNAGAPENLLAVFWDDLNFGGVQRAYYHNDGTRFIVQYQDVPKTGGGGPFTFQAILYPSGRIVYQYLTIGTLSDAATVGIQNAARNDGLTVAFNTDYVRAGLAIELRRIPQWLSVSPASGRVYAGASTPLDVALNATDMLGGLYQGQVRIASNDPASPETVIPVDLTVVGVADIDIPRASIDFGQVFVGGSRTDTLAIWNRGTNPLLVTELATSPADFEVSPASLTVPIGEQVPVLVTFRPGSATPISGVLVVRSDDPDEPELTVALQGAGIVAPDIAVAPSSLSAALLTGQNETRTVAVANEGGSDLEFEARVTNIVFPAPTPESTPPSRSAGEIQSGYAAHAADPGSTPPAAPVPGVQPGVIPYWERLQAALAAGTVIFHDDMESGPNGWTHAPTSGLIDRWTLSTTRSSSGATSWRAMQHDLEGAAALRSPAIDLTFQRDAMLSFQHWYQFDDCEDPAFEPDGGLVEISTNGGATWTQIAPVGGYPYLLDDVCGNPLALRSAYSHDGGVGGAFIPAVFDLTPFVGGEILLRFHAGWDCGNCASNEGWYIDDVTVSSSGPPVLSVTPGSGIVPSGASLDLSARFDALGLFGGDYTMDLVVASNDPDEPVVTVPASLHVTGAADIDWVPAAIDFGTVFLGFGATDTILVVNAGTDVLHVAGVSSDHAAFAVPGAPFDLAPGAVRALAVSFTPAAVAPFAAVVTIASNDADEPSVTVSLSGAGALAPDIAVDPSSLTVDLFTGETAERTLTVSNGGGSDLSVEIAVERPPGPLGFGFTPSTSVPSTASSLESRDDTAVAATPGGPGAATGEPPSVLVIQNTSAWGLNMGSFISMNFGITPTVISSAQIATTDFSAYDLIVTVGDESTPYYSALSQYFAKFEAYAAAGGVIQYQLATQGDNVDLPRGVQALFGHAESENQVMLPGHPIVAGLPSTLHGNAANHTYLAGLPAEAQIVTRTASSGHPTTVEYPVGAGLVVATGMTWEWLYLNGYDAGPMLYQATEYSLSRGRPRWVSVSPAAVTVPAGGSADLLVAFDASGLLGGRYDARIRLASNDPDEPIADVPATMNVTGVPILEVSPASLDFGPLYVGLTAARTFRVRNTGTDALVVTGTSIDDPSYAASPEAYSVAIGDTQTVTVVFAPASPGAKPATLSLAHNAAGSPTPIALAGIGIDPPDISTDPASLSADLRTGETEEQTLTVRNTGGSDLEFTIALGPGAAEAAPGSPVEPPAALRGPTPNETNPTTEPPAVQAFYSGTHLQFGISVYGEIMPYEAPAGFEHLAAGSWVSGYTVAYIGPSGDRLAYAGYSQRASLAPVSYTEIENSPTQVVVEVVTRTQDNVVTIRRRITFPRADWFVRIVTTLETAPGIPAGEVVYKEFADWDVDTDWEDDGWDYDPARHMTYAWDQHYVAIASREAPDLMDLYGWNDYTQRATIVDFPFGPVVGFDGLEILHFNLGNLDGAETASIATAYGAAPTLAELREVLGRGVGFVDWLTVTPQAGTVPAGGSIDLAVRFDPGLLLTGDYAARILHHSNDPDEPMWAVPVTMHVTGVPLFDASPTALQFDTLYIGESRARDLTIFNRGTETLLLSGFSFDDDAFSGGSPPVSIPPGDSAVIAITFAPATAGAREATLSIVHNADGSPSSVALHGVALVPPFVTLSPEAIDAVVEVRTIGHETLTIGNSGGSDLRFLLRPESGGAVPVNLEEPPGKGEPDARVGDVVALGAGGPDQFGYRWIDSDQPGGPVFQWVDIRAIGTAIPVSGDDQTSSPLPIGFAFPFYGQEFTSVRVCTNGFLSFTSPSANYSNTPLPSPFAPPHLLAAFWDDLFFDPGSSAHYRYDGTRFIVQFHAVRHLSGGGPYTFEVILYPSGAILYQYLTMAPPLDGCTVGIQNGLFNDGLTIDFNQSYLHDAMALRISAAPEWITTNPSEGVVPAGGSVPVDVRIDAGNLFPGDYQAAISVSSNDPLSPFRVVPVSARVIGVPHLSTSPATLQFDTLYVGQTATRPLVVTNVGSAPLVMTAVTAGRPDFTATPNSFTLQPLQSATVQVTFTAGTAGVRNSHLALTSNDPDSPSLIPLFAVALVPPVASVSPGSVEAVSMPGGSATRTIVVGNTGGSDLRYRIETTDITRAPVSQGSYLALAKEEPDPRAGETGVGGPDAFGHFWIDSDDPGGPAFQWTDIGAVGTQVPFASFSDDQSLGPFPIGFLFPFYGQHFTEFRVCTNGFISFTSSSNAYANQPLPNAGAGVPENMLAAFWDDLIHRTDLGSSVSYHSDGARLVVQFTNMQTFGPAAPFAPTFQIILKPSGEVTYQYLHVGNLATGTTVGMQNGTRDDGLNVAFNAAYPHDGMAVRITSVVPWISAEPALGVVPAGQSRTVTLSFDAGDLEEGDYTAVLRTHSNDPVHSNLATDVLFHVNAVEATEAVFDPNTLNLESNGRFTNAYVELPAWLDPNGVVLSTVRFRGEVAPEQMMSGDFNQNGVPDLQFRLTRLLVEAALPEGDDVPVWITGEIGNTHTFAAHGTVRVIRPRVTAPNGGDLVLSGTPYLVRWANPTGWSVDEAAVYYSLDLGASWSLVAEHVTGESVVWNVPDAVTTQAMVRVYLFDNAGVMGYDSSDEVFAIVNTITGVETAEVAESLPKANALYQNAPNPFNPVTEIRFDLPRSAEVALDVFAVDGRRIRALLQKPMPAGRHRVLWDGRDDGGRPVGSGVYLYRVKAGSYEAARRMILVK